jgi:8-oxo-dGTP pyrophosphatase MutT (NUDIX family)
MRRSGDGFVTCSCGQRHWGRFGAAGLLVVHHDTALLQHRALWSHEGGTWGVPGGAIDAGEAPLQAALREAAEEAAVPADAVRPRHAWTTDHGTWAYTTVIGEALTAFEPQTLDGESQELRWVPLVAVPDLPLHSGFAAGWTAFRPLLDHREVVVVDAANVIGSTPDGWWRDRAGAVRRLVAGLSEVAASGVPARAALLPDLPGRSRAWPEWLVVREGAARAGTLPDRRVGVVDAPGSGDDEIVRLAIDQRSRGHDVTVVTADRALRERVEQVGARTVGPRTLTRVLAAQDSESTD